MSRTYRKPKFDHYKTETWHVEDHVNYLVARISRYGDHFSSVRVRKTEEEYERDVAAADARYEADCREVRKRFWYCWNKPNDISYKWYLSALPERFRYHVSKYRREYKLIDYDAERAEARREFAKRTRDGYCNETGCNTAYKCLSKETVRNAVRRLEHKILRDDDWDHLPYPDTYLGKKHIWDVW
jgi:hypothetical protein